MSDQLTNSGSDHLIRAFELKRVRAAPEARMYEHTPAQDVRGVRPLLGSITSKCTQCRKSRPNADFIKPSGQRLRTCLSCRVFEKIRVGYIRFTGVSHPTEFTDQDRKRILKILLPRAESFLQSHDLQSTGSASRSRDNSQSHSVRPDRSSRHTSQSLSFRPGHSSRHNSESESSPPGVRRDPCLMSGGLTRDSLQPSATRTMSDIRDESPPGIMGRSSEADHAIRPLSMTHLPSGLQQMLPLLSGQLDTAKPVLQSLHETDQILQNAPIPMSVMQNLERLDNCVKWIQQSSEAQKTAAGAPADPQVFFPKLQSFIDRLKSIEDPDILAEVWAKPGFQEMLTTCQVLIRYIDDAEKMGQASSNGQASKRPSGRAQTA